MNTTDKIMALADAYASQAKMVGLASPLKTRDVLRAEIEALVRDAERYRWLTDDHADAEMRDRAEDIGVRLRWVGKGAADAAIDAAIQEKQS